MKNLSNKLIMIGLLIAGLVFGACMPITPSETETVEDIKVFTDTLILDNQGEIDAYAVDGGRWLVISLDDLQYIVKKKRKTIVSELESLFERFEVPDKIKVKPTFK